MFYFRILIDEDEDEDLKRAIELSLLEQDPNYKSNKNTPTETKKRKHDGNSTKLIYLLYFDYESFFLTLDVAITERKEDKPSSTMQDWTEPQLFFKLHRIRGISPKGNVESVSIQQLITVRAKPSDLPINSLIINIIILERCEESYINDVQTRAGVAIESLSYSLKYSRVHLPRRRR